MENFWDIFKQICKIPHCSGSSAEMLSFIQKWGKKHGYSVKTDKASNVICYHDEATMTLQSHYDMVCIGRAPDIELKENATKMWAEDSSLGADNGIGVAMMLLAMQDNLPVDCLFTADEEIGLLGAKALELTIKTETVLNLDTEEDESVYIGCAGGIDMIATLPLKRKHIKNAKYYEFSVDNLPGGHSGLEIDKKIPNANIELVKFLEKYELFVTDIVGGQRRNAISKSAKAIVTFAEDVKVPDAFKEAGSQEHIHFYEDTEVLLNALKNMPHGVKKDNTIYNIPHNSVNFALMKIEDHHLVVTLSLRSMDAVGMNQLLQQTRSYLDTFGFTIKEENEYPAWIPEKSEFAKRLANVVEEVEGFVEFKAIHAGLECAVLKRKASKLDFASIGPNITGAHTNKEAVEKGSVERFKEIVYKFVEAEQAFANEEVEEVDQGTREKGTRKKKSNRRRR